MAIEAHVSSTEISCVYFFCCTMTHYVEEQQRCDIALCTSSGSCLSNKTTVSRSAFDKSSPCLPCHNYTVLIFEISGLTLTWHDIILITRQVRTGTDSMSMSVLSLCWIAKCKRTVILINSVTFARNLEKLLKMEKKQEIEWYFCRVQQPPFTFSPI